MNRRNFLVLLLVSASAFGADLPPAERLLDRFVEVTGGAQAYKARKTEISRGTVEMTAMGVKGTLVRYAAEPDHYLVVMEIPGIGKVLSGVKDGVAWEMSDLMGARTKTGVERGEALREARFNANAVWRELYTKVETVGEESVGGEPCYKLLMTPTEGAAETLYLSKKTGLGVKMTVIASTQMGDIPAEMLFSDYKNFGGILTPVRVVSRTAGQEILITLQAVEANPEIPAGQFDLPPEIAAQATQQN
jgi:hypothetical protein